MDRSIHLSFHLSIINTIYDVIQNYILRITSRIKLHRYPSFHSIRIYVQEGREQHYPWSRYRIFKHFHRRKTCEYIQSKEYILTSKFTYFTKNLISMKIIVSRRELIIIPWNYFQSKIHFFLYSFYNLFRYNGIIFTTEELKKKK